MAAGRREHGQQGDRLADAAHLVPRNPNAVRSAEFGRRIMRSELFRGEAEPTAGRLGRRAVRRLVVSIHDQLAFDGNRLFLGVIEVQAAAEPPRRHLARLVVHGVRPDRDQPHRSLELTILQLLVAARQGQLVGHRRHAAKFQGLTAGQQGHGEDGQPASRCYECHP